MAFRVISGKNLLSYILEDSSYADLYKNTTTFQNFPSTKRRQFVSDKVAVSEIKMQPYTGTQELLCKAATRTDNQKYLTQIMFLDVTYTDTSEGNVVTFKAVDNKDYNINPIRLTDTNVKVSCDCLDFYHTFAYHNNRDDSLLGKPPEPYVKKTDRKPRNINRVAGTCKHLIAMAGELREAGLIK